jgi:hypothetical protein
MGLSLWEPDLSWPDLIDQLREPLLWHPQLLDYGFVRTTTDAHGIQILTGAHLAKAHDLSVWTISEVAPDRYLVEAADLAAWYAQPHPAPATLTQARADFGDAASP